MRNFFASFFGALVGILLAFFLAVIICIGIVNHAASSFTQAISSFTQKGVKTVSNPSVLEIKLNHVIAERTVAGPFSFNFHDTTDMPETVGLNDILADIGHAAKDYRIKGILLNLATIPAGMATIEAVRNKLLQFKSSGKFIIAYGLSYTQKSYYLASVADKVYLYPEGEVYWKGLSAQILFFKKALDKLGIQVQVFRHGRFKSYVEPYILDKMSPDNRLQTRMFLASMWKTMLSDISLSRHISVIRLNQMADSMTIRSAESAKKYGMVDSLLFPDQVMAKIIDAMQLPEDSYVSFIGLDDYRKSFHLNRFSPSKIAIIYASGDIVQGKGNSENIGATRMVEAIRQARLDDDVKAIVFRVNSPGGSALASEEIWREIYLAKKVKPVIVSMGDYGASGGYEISCAATEIVAEPTTLTGSIGVFGMLPNLQGFLNNKLGITTDTVSTNTHSAAGSILYPLTSPEAMVLQAAIESFYHNFISRVANGRNLTVAQVDSIAQGRVWTGEQAVKIGLVDTLGGINLALKIAAYKAHLAEYHIVELPELYSPLHRLLNKFSADAEAKTYLRKTLGAMYSPVQGMLNLMKTKSVQARIPYNYIIQ